MSAGTTAHVIVDPNSCGTLSCLHCHATHNPDLPLAVEQFVSVCRGFVLMHKHCAKPVVPSKQTTLFEEPAREGPARLGHANYVGFPGYKREAIDAATDTPAPEIDPPGHELQEHDKPELTESEPEDPDDLWDAFSARWPQARTATALHADLSTALQHGTPPHLFADLAKHPPSSGTFQAMAHWARLKIAHMNHEEYPDVWLPDMMSMPEALAELLKSKAPKKKAGARPLSSGAKAKKRRSGSTAHSA